MSDTFAKVTSNDPAIVSAAVYSVLSAVGAATASYTLTDGVISMEIGKAEPVKVVNTIVVTAPAAPVVPVSAPLDAEAAAPPAEVQA